MHRVFTKITKDEAYYPLRDNKRWRCAFCVSETIITFRKGEIWKILKKLKKYQSPTYADFLKEKCVLDAQQFLRSGLRSFRDTLIIRKWFESICDKSGDNEVKLFWAASTEIAGHYYDDKEILNILTFDWIFRITNGLDCLLQYINAALNFGIETKWIKKLY